MIQERDKTSPQDTWDVETLYPTFQLWEEALQKQIQASPWKDIQVFKGTLHKGAETLKTFLETYYAASEELETLYTYSRLRHDEDLAQDTYKQAHSRALSLYHDFHQSTAWMQPEVLSLSEELLQSYLESPLLEPYRFNLEKIIRLKPHTLSSDQEELLARAAKPLSTAQKAFSALNNADFVFGTVEDSHGHTHELTHGSYNVLLRSSDRTLRQRTFEQLHGTFESYENTLCELLAGQTQQHAFLAKSRHYNSCLEAALYPKNIDTSVYHNLIQTVRERIGAHHNYVSLRKQILGLEDLHLYDMYVSLARDVDIRMDYEEAAEITGTSMAPLGKEYQEALVKGLGEARWVDRYENKNKRSGAYSGGCYRSHPFILMNYKGILRDVSTLSHEAGHSMHSFLSRKHQPYHTAHYPIFVAEVASTFNEELLTQELLRRFTKPEEQLFLLNQKLEDIRGTLFRQTMFAEFELWIHEQAEANAPLTPSLLKEKYRELNEFYFGKDCVIDNISLVEWARVPHFYFNFYVYQYATGVSAALSLVERVLKGGEKEREDYLNFLKSGGSRDPLDLLKLAGVDMTQPEPIVTAIAHFDEVLKQVETLSKQVLSTC